MGVEKGCAAEVDVAAGTSLGLGLVAVVVWVVTVSVKRLGVVDIFRNEL
jgi:hypothetical protein